MALNRLQYYSKLQFYNNIFKLRMNNKTTAANTKLNFQPKLLSYKIISCKSKILVGSLKNFDLLSKDFLQKFPKTFVVI